MRIRKLTRKECQDIIFKEIDQALKIISDEELEFILNMAYSDVFGDMPCDHLGTFVEVKDMPIKIEDFKKYSIKWVLNWEDINENNSTR